MLMNGKPTQPQIGLSPLMAVNQFTLVKLPSE